MEAIELVAAPPLRGLGVEEASSTPTSLRHRLACLPMDTFNNAASSFRPRPVPVHTLREPQAFLVKEAPAVSGPASTSRNADAAAVRQSYVKKVELQKRALAWTESLLEDDVSRANFKLACAHLTRTTYLHILHERHLSDLCAYPLCARPPRRPYRAYSLPRSRIVAGPNNTRLVINVTGNDDDGFCSPQCRRRAEWVARVEGAFGDGLWEDGEEDDVRVGRWKLLEEVEEGEPGLAETTDLHGPSLPVAIEPRSQSPVAADVLAALRIVEKPTPVAAPAPPSLPSPTPAADPIRAAFGLRPPQAAAPSMLEGSQPTTAQIREHERRRRADASNSSLVPSDVIGFADSLITSIPAEVQGSAGEAAMKGEIEETATETFDEEDEAWGLMEAARQKMHGPP